MSRLKVVTRLQHHRTDIAAKAVEEAIGEVRRAEQCVTACQEALEEQRQFAQRRELEIYADLCNSIVRRKRFDDVRIDIHILKNDTLQCEQELMKAERNLEKMQAALASARERYRLCMVRAEKFDSLSTREQQQEQLAAQAAEDAALEEVVELMQVHHAH